MRGKLEGETLDDTQLVVVAAVLRVAVVVALPPEVRVTLLVLSEQAGSTVAVPLAIATPQVRFTVPA